MPINLCKNMIPLLSEDDWKKLNGEIIFPPKTSSKNGRSVIIQNTYKQTLLAFLGANALLEENISKIVRIYTFNDMFFERSVAGLLYDEENKIAMDIGTDRKTKASEYKFASEQVMLTLFDNKRARKKFFPQVKKVLYKREYETNFEYFTRKLIG